MTSKPDIKNRSYRDFLTPALHRRFTHASLLVLAFCWLEATLMSSGGMFWSWFPIGFTGMRTLLLFCPCLGIFILRLSGLHLGERMAISGFERFLQCITSPRTAMALVWHLYSAFFFGEVFIWSQKPDANLGWVDHGRAYERPRLNENPVILRSLFFILAVMQTALHIYKDRDQVPILQQEEANLKPTGTLGPGTPKPLLKLADRAPAIASNVINLTIAGLVCISALYFILIRRFAWPWAYFLGKMIFSQLPSNSAPPGLTRVPALFWQAATSSLMLVALWEVSNEVFSIFVAEPPLKKGQPLTSEIKDNAGAVISRSTDPNGSLITGMKSMKEVPKTFAYWELSLVCAQYEARRRSIFAEVDRQGGSTWSQICQHCLQEIGSIDTRIKQFQEPAVDKSKQQYGPARQEGKAGQGLPRIANQMVNNGDIVSKSKPDFVRSMGNVTRSLGQSSDAQDPLTPNAKRALEWGASRVFTREQQSQLSKQSITAEASARMMQILRTPLGEPFRETFARRVNAVVFGSPYSKRANIVHAARSLSALLRASLVEDSCGIAAKDVPRVVRVLTATIRTIRQFVYALQPSWTDVDFRATNRRVEETDDTVVELQKALEGILLTFAEYAPSLGMSKKELREAKEAVTMNAVQEMIKV